MIRTHIRSLLWPIREVTQLLRADGAQDDGCNLAWILMLPEPEDRPAMGSEEIIYFSISLDVPLQLGDPVLAVAGWGGGVLWAPVPETAIDEHCNAPPRKDDVGAAAAPERGEVHAVSSPCGVQVSADLDLGDRVSPAVAEHRPAHPWARRPRTGL